MKKQIHGHSIAGAESPTEFSGCVESPQGNAAHTPGPWEFMPIETGQGRIQKFQVRAEVFTVTLRNPADARLIAAAPDLLAALEALIGRDANGHIQYCKDELFRCAPEIPAMARAAIAKAKS